MQTTDPSASPAVTEVRDRDLLSEFFRRDAGLHIYEIGDLDPFFWPHTTWYCLGRAQRAGAIALLYSGSDEPTLLLFDRGNSDESSALISALPPRLPGRFRAHLSLGLVEALGEKRVEARERHHRMLLAHPQGLGGIRAPEAERLTAQNTDEVLAFYRASYPGNWFVARMLETGQYLGVRDSGKLVCVTGVHVFSPTYRVAALGNIATAPSHRGRGLARRVTAKLCRSLLACGVDTIGLNVHAENAAAIRCYQRLGFECLAEFDECEVELGQVGS